MTRANTPASVTAWQVAALLPPVLAALLLRGAGGGAVLAVAVVTTLVWDLVFSRTRSASPSWHSLTTALILAVMVPPEVPLWQLALAASFGVALGEQVFGGRGFGFLNAATVALAFLVFSFPGTALAGDEQQIAFATLPGLVVLILRGLAFWRLLAGLMAGLAVGHFIAQGNLPAPEVAVAMTFAATFLVADPVAAAATRAGRWMHGLLAGLLAVLLSGAGAVHALVFAALLASLAAPLIDHLVIIAHSRRRVARDV